MRAIAQLFITFSFFITSFSAFAQGGLYFPPTGNDWTTVEPASLGWDVSKLDEFKNFLETNNTKSFIVLKDGKIAMEYYFNGHDASKPWYWASAGKSLTSVLAAFAEADGQLNTEKPSSTYLGKGWSSCTEAQENNILVRHHLTMTTGLDDSSNSDCTDKECLKYKADPGTRWAYHNAPYTLLDGIITGATGQNLNQYFKTKLGDKIGMTGLFVKTDYNNVFYSTTRNMARYGLFVLAKGNWNGNTILNNATYIEKMSKSSQNLNPSYGYLWWLNGKDKFMLPGTQFVFNGPLIPTAPVDMFSALGKNDQKIHIVPSLNVVVIRMGEPYGDGENNVPIIFDAAIWERLSKIMNLSTATNEVATATLIKQKVAFYFDKTIRIIESVDVADIEIVGSNGSTIIKSKNTHEVNVSNLPQGIYSVRISTREGSYYINKVFVH
jgi:Beta-lactamase/Secretion system C-terminal sorting domain